MSLPFLPGRTPKDLSRTSFGRSAQFGFINGVPTAKKTVVELSQEEVDALVSAQPSFHQRAPRVVYPPVLPAHVALDKKVLLFNAFFKQTVHESADEFYRVRAVKIYYYLEDDTISVVEPVVENSGLPQGKLVNRQRLPKDSSGAHWTWKDLNLGANINIYGRVFHIVDCNAWTREWLTSQGIEVGPSEPMPVDPFTAKRSLVDKPDHSSRTPSDFDKLKQFIALDRRVLRFFCVWDDRDQMFGEKRRFVLHYYLVDDTLEVREVHENNDGRDPFPVLLKRQKVPRNFREIDAEFPTIVMELKETELNDCLGPADLAIGKTVNIYSRPFLLYDCDEFTKEFYRRNFGVTDFTSIDVEEPRPPVVKAPLPPHTGFGSPEDALQGWYSLRPEPPTKDYLKMYEYGNQVLRFAAKFLDPKPEDATRRFILSYHLANDEISIYEPPQRNSGIIGGKFLESRKIEKPTSNKSFPTYYTLADIHIGCILEINKFQFVLEDADDFVRKFMAKHPTLFPRQDPQLLAMRSNGRAPVLVQSDEELMSAVMQVQEILRRANYNNHTKLQRAFLSYDVDRAGYISHEDLKRLCCRRFHLPIDESVLDKLLSYCDIDGNGKIDYNEFVQFLSWTPQKGGHPASPGPRASGHK